MSSKQHWIYCLTLPDGAEFLAPRRDMVKVLYSISWYQPETWFAKLYMEPYVGLFHFNGFILTREPVDKCW